MSLSSRLRLGRGSLSTSALIATISALLVVSAPGARTHQTGDHHKPARKALTAREAKLQDAMRKLWEDHITWTRLAIVSFAADLPDLGVTQERLLRNQVDIGNAIKPYYGRAAGNRLTALLDEHIRGAVALLVAAKSGDQAAIAQASAAWYANGNEVADFLAAANPRHWPRSRMRAMMRTHLDQTLSEAQNRLTGQFAADVRDYDAIHRHILRIADVLSTGIMRQFPRRFR